MSWALIVNILSNYCMRLSRIWRILQVEESVIHRGRITPSEICRILHILREPNSIIALLFIQNILFTQTCKLYSRSFLSSLNDTTSCPGFLGQWFNNFLLQWCNNLQRAALLTLFWRQWFNNLQRAALLTSSWRQWFNNLQRAALLTSLVQYDKILGQQQLFMVNYTCGFDQSEAGKYFEWIIITANWLWRQTCSFCLSTWATNATVERKNYLVQQTLDVKMTFYYMEECFTGN